MTAQKQLVLFHDVSDKIWYQFLFLDLRGFDYNCWVVGYIRKLDMRNQAVIKTPYFQAGNILKLL